MRTTIDLPDELFRRVKARAARDGVKLKDLITSYVEQGLTQPARVRSEPPIFGSQVGPPLPLRSNAELFALLDEEGS